MGWRAFVLALALISACVEPQIDTVGVTSTTRAELQADGRPVVPAGTAISLRLEDGLDTATSEVGDAFRARVEFDVRATDGSIVVRRGSELHGRVASIGRKSAPRLRLWLESIDTVEGAEPLQASVRVARPIEYPGPPPRGAVDSLCDEPSSAATRPDPFCASYLDRIHDSSAGEHGYGRLPPSDARPQEVRLPAGARLGLVLAEPLRLP
jgi:hypothetical protein